LPGGPRTDNRRIWILDSHLWCGYVDPGTDWGFLTNHAKALLFIAERQDARLLDDALALDVTERTAFGIVADLTEAGYVLKERDGRRNRYHIQGHLPMPEELGKSRTIGEVLDLLVEARGSGGDDSPCFLLGSPSLQGSASSLVDPPYADTCTPPTLVHPHQR